MAKKKTTFNIPKNKNFSEWYSEILNKAEICDIRYNVKGFVVIRPWGTRIIDKMYQIYESALQRTGHEPAIFPTVIPEENLKKEASHIEGFTPEVFWLEQKQGEDRLALRPTSETAFYQMYSMWIRSYRDLPLKLYQKANIFRYETKATRPLLRAREFYWIESHNAFATKKQAEDQVKEDIEITKKVLHHLFCVPFLPMKRPKWDTFAGAEYTIGNDSILPDGKVVQQPSTHLLGQHFSKAFNIKFKDKDEKEKFVWQTCYGPAMSRILASVISIHGDDNGLIIPFILSPIQTVIIPIYKESNKKQIEDFAQKILALLEQGKISAKIDATEKRPGDKYFFWEMKGVPFRIEIGEKEMNQNKVSVFIRDTREKIQINIEDLPSKINELGIEFDARLKKKADKEFEEKIVFCKTKEEIKKAINSGKVAKFEFCSLGEEGEKCAEFIEKELASRVMGERADIKEKPKGKCVICGKKANAVAYAGKSY